MSARDSEGYQRALALLKASCLEEGFVASTDDPHYSAIWARDAALSSLAAFATGDPELLEGARRSMETLADHRSSLGHIPNAYWPKRNYWDWGESGCVDAQAWFVITCWLYVERTHDEDFLRRMWRPCLDAFTWLRYQDANNFGLIDSPPASEWVDSTLNRTGKVLLVNVLYYAATLAIAKLAARAHEPVDVNASQLARKVNALFWPTRDGFDEVLSHVSYPGEAVFPHMATQNAYENAIIGSRRHYVSHVQFGKVVDVLDVPAQCLGVMSGVASGERAGLVLDALTAFAVDNPFPSRAFAHPPAPSDGWGVDPVAETHQPPRWRNAEWEYHNGAVWPYIGGLQILALVEASRNDEATDLLPQLEAANRAGSPEWGFHEWLHGQTGAPGGARNQAWSAALYVAACAAVDTQRQPFAALRR